MKKTVKKTELAEVLHGSMPPNLAAILNSIAQQPQRQDATNDQLRDLAVFANRLGLYDAADAIRLILSKPPVTKKGEC